LAAPPRQCDGINKETFRVFDAVGIYDALQGMTAMRPVVVDPAIGFTQLAQELCHAPTEEARSLVRDQFVAKLQRKKRHLSETAARDFETRAGMAPDLFITELRRMPLADVAQGRQRRIQRRPPGTCRPRHQRHGGNGGDHGRPAGHSGGTGGGRNDE
jgi:type I restriction enzyme R subunit